MAENRHAHLAVVNSHEESRRWHDAAMKVLAKVREDSYEACASGPCDGGRRLCPSPQACRLHIESRLHIKKIARLAAKRAAADLPWSGIVRILLAFGVAGLVFYGLTR